MTDSTNAKLRELRERVAKTDIVERLMDGLPTIEGTRIPDFSEMLNLYREAAAVISRLRAENYKLSRRIHFQRGELHWLNRWMMGNLREHKKLAIQRTLLSSYAPVVSLPDDLDRRKKAWELLWRRIRMNKWPQKPPQNDAMIQEAGE